MNLIEQLIAPLEKLIVEHGSAAVLREHLALVKAQLTDQEARYRQTEAENTQLKARALDAEERARKAEEQLQALKSRQHGGPCCDSCGSFDVRRSGTRNSAGPFGALGLKEALYTCTDCGHVSAVELPING